MKEAREEFASICKYRMGQSYGDLVYYAGYRPDSDVWDNRRILGIASIFIDSLAAKMDTVLMIFLPAMAISLIMAVWGNYMRKKIKGSGLM